MRAANYLYPHARDTSLPNKSEITGSIVYVRRFELVPRIAEISVNRHIRPNVTRKRKEAVRERTAIYALCRIDVKRSGLKQG